MPVCAAVIRFTIGGMLVTTERWDEQPASRVFAAPDCREYTEEIYQYAGADRSRVSLAD